MSTKSEKSISDVNANKKVDKRIPKPVSSNDLKKLDKTVLDNVLSRAHYLFTQMIYQANHRADVEKGDPKVGGHPAASASALHILAALHLIVKTGFDHIANKPHASPADHALNYLLDLFLHEDLSKMSLEECNQAMMGLRAFSKNGEPVLQSYHSAYDPDRHNFFPSGTVGIPPVKAGYLAHAYHFAKDHGYTVPSAHFWSIVGDSEFREGSLFEAIPDFAEREIGNLTWIIDYNRQSLDGHRITNKEIMDGTDDSRIERTMLANGWHVIQVRHGKLREALFKKPGGKLFKDFLENVLEDYELQSLLLVEDMKTLKKGIVAHHPDLKEFMTNITDEELYLGLRDLGGHDIFSLAEAMIESKKDLKRPTVIIAHTIKGWGLHMAAAAGNHSSLASKTEIDELREQQGLDEKTLFARFKENTKEAKFLKQRGEDLYRDILEQDRIRKANQEMIASELEKFGSLPSEMGINLKLASYPHTQWMLGQITAKLSRIANTSLDEAKLKKGQKPLEDDEKPWKLPGELMVHMAPDVGTSTNLNPTMDGRIFGAPVVQDFESDFGVKNKKHPDLVPHEENDDRYLRFEIAEGNVMSCLGSFGKMRDITGIPFIPLMTVYDFFVKRALDQYFYDLYWKSSFILVGTPSGVTLSPEGAQHGWKSDFQIPNQITWEPFYCVELDWIMADAIHRHLTYTNEGRTGVLIRGVTKGIDQKQFLKLLKTQARFKSEPVDNLCHKDFMLDGGVSEDQIACVSDEQILGEIQQDVLKGAYFLINYKNYKGYIPGENVIHIFAMGALVDEAIKASEKLLQEGIYANVVSVTSPDLLIGNLAQENDYEYLKHDLGVSDKLHITSEDFSNIADMVSISGRRVPIVSTHDGEPGLLDNIGSIVGVKHEALAVRKHSKCGRPADVYKYHGIDQDGIVSAAKKVLAETALEGINVSSYLLAQAAEKPSSIGSWKDLV